MNLRVGLIVGLALCVNLLGVANAGATTLLNVAGAVANTDPTQTNRIFRDSVRSSCDSAKPTPGTSASASPHYDLFNVINPNAVTTCLSVTLTQTGTKCHVVGYAGTFNPASVTANYAGDFGSSDPVAQFSILVPADATAPIVVHEVNPSTGCSYSLVVSTIPSLQQKPRLFGPNEVGTIINSSNGNWTGVNTFAGQWQRCDATGSTCDDIVGATGSTYKPVAADVGMILRREVTATDGPDTAVAFSEPIGPIATLGPRPGYTAATQEGVVAPSATSQLDGSNCPNCITPVTFPFPVDFAGISYDSAAVSTDGYLSFGGVNHFAPGILPSSSSNPGLFLWPIDQRADAPGEGIFTATSGAAPNRTFDLRWVTHRLFDGGLQRYVLRFDEATGKISFFYNLTSLLQNTTIGAQLTSKLAEVLQAGGAQFSIPSGRRYELTPSRPQITGTAKEGETLTVTQAIWRGTSPVISDTWLRCNAAGLACIAIPGATTTSYKPVAADVGSTLVVSETATDENGPGVVIASDPTAVVASQPPKLDERKCTVPKLKQGTGLPAVKKKLTGAGCKAGKVTRAHSKRVHKGKLVRLKTKAGTSKPLGTKIDLVLSSGPAS